MNNKNDIFYPFFMMFTLPSKIVPKINYNASFAGMKLCLCQVANDNKIANYRNDMGDLEKWQS